VPGFLLVSQDAAGSVVGFAHVIVHDDIAHLEQLSVAPEYGRQGHGRRLLEAAMAEATRRGFEAMTLRTYREVAWNGPFYASAGFTEEDPATAFHRALVVAEHEEGIDRFATRVQMAVALR
jgi:GNAT superfamily N-acetyltransferase